jgi:hypothetical protein
VPVVVNTPDAEQSNTVLVNVTAQPTISISVTPGTASVRVQRTKQFSATVQGTSNQSAIWKVNGIVGGNNTLGSITQAGLYRAPNRVPQPAQVIVSATAGADQSKTATATVTITKR